MGIVGAARTALLVAHDPNDESLRTKVVAGIKNNLMEMPSSLAYHLEYSGEHDCARIVWDGISQHSAETLLTVVDPDQLEEVARCGEILKSMLSDQQVAIGDILKRMRALNISDKALARARRMLNLYETVTRDGVWWGLP